MDEQAQKLGVQFDAVVFATSSGGTQAGLSTGAGETDWPGELHGISVDHTISDLQAVADPLTVATAELLEIVQPHPVQVHDAYIGEGYGIVGDRNERPFSQWPATKVCWWIRSTQAGRWPGLSILVRKEAARSVLFWHTGGTPALFAYEQELLG